MTVRLGINGFGRIGRDVLRCVLDRPDSPIDVLGVNDLTSPETLAHLLAYDPTYGRLSRPVDARGSIMAVGKHRVHMTSCASPVDLPWAALEVDVMIESTGQFRTRKEASAQLKAGARKVVISAVGEDVDATVVLGVNDTDYDPQSHDVISNASCTTNGLAPMVKELNDAFGVRRGFLTTIHCYTNDQAPADGPGADARRSRSAAVGLVRARASAARAIGEVIPALAGKLAGVAVRAPIENGCLTVELEKAASAKQANQAFAHAAAGEVAKYLHYTEAPLASRDIVGETASCVFDASLTGSEGPLLKVFGWYDNEWGIRPPHPRTGRARRPHAAGPGRQQPAIVGPQNHRPSKPRRTS